MHKRTAFFAAVRATRQIGARGSLVVLVLAAVAAAPGGCGSASDHGHGDAGSAPDTGANPADGPGASDLNASADAMDGSACTVTGISEEQATRLTDAGSVTASAAFLNAVDGCWTGELRFKLVLDTHSVALDAIDLPASARVETSLGAQVSSGFLWAGGSESSHHRDGVLSVAAPSLAGSSWLRLTLLGIAGVDRTFTWDGSSLSTF